jgi:uncharacterized protein YdaU (DUF1376 family)
MFYYQHHIGDYRRDTGHLTLLEHGIYRQLLDHYYISEKPLDANAMRLVCVRTTDECEAYARVLADFFVERDGVYFHKRCDHEIDKFKGKSAKAMTSAKARWNKNNDLGIDANALPTHTEGNANQLTNKPINQLTNKESTSDASRPTPARKKVPLPSDFAVSPRVSAWATEKGFDRLPDHLDAFRRKAEMNAYRYADWDLAFMEAVREDWAKLRGNGRAGPAPIAVPDGSITCESCGVRTRSFTGRKCDPCWRGVVNPRVAA